MKQKVEPASTQVAVFLKDSKCGVLRLDITGGGTTLSANDDSGIRTSRCQTPAIGRELFLDSIAASVDVGWRVRFLGKPNDAANS